MKKILVTGGSGALGYELIPRLAKAGYSIRGMSRRPAPAGIGDEIEWRQADLESKTGWEDALSDVDTIVHCASSALNRMRQVDVDGTARLLELARAARVKHVVYISIVGIDRIPFTYYRAKLAAEKLIESSAIPWSILRATQFHTLIDLALRGLTRVPLFLMLDTRLQFQLIDPGEVADCLVDCVKRGPRERLPDIGGPQVQSFGDLAQIWLASRRIKRRLVHVPFPGKLAAGFRAGLNCVPGEPYGKVTWAQWLVQRRVGF